MAERSMWRVVHAQPNRVVLQCARCKSLVEVNQPPMHVALARHESDCPNASLVARLLRFLFNLPLRQKESS